ncbi:MAG TPA: FAD-dependent monooxygenase [Pyrinomonadaceae bacterium]|jgi:2-polyprenyl-6-methoxyphenol hydroxylase-like FAD-dependent oxidoreductase
METDVIIVGAGPTGLSLACQLFRYGIDFVILDKNDGISRYSKAIGVQARTLEIYEQIGLAQDLVDLGAKAEKAQLVEGGEVRGKIELSEIGQGLSPYPFLLLVEQNKHEEFLLNYLKTNEKDVLWQTELLSFSQDENGVTANIKTGNGEIKTIRAKYLVGCDGAKSPVRHGLDLTFEGSTFDRLFYVADVEINWNFSHDSLYVCLAQSTITAFFPLPGENRFRIVGTFPENEERREGEILYEEIERQIATDTKLNLDIHDVNWFSVYRVHSRRVNKFSEGRCFLAGDSAHIHTPAGAQGMNTGIQDGYNLAWKMAQVLGGKADPKILDSYNEERLENAKNLLETTDRIFEFGASPETFTSYIRTHIFPYIANFALSLSPVKNFIFPLISQIGINYRHSSLSDHFEDANFKIKSGDRMPYFLIEGESIYDCLKAPKFHLLTFSDGQTDSQILRQQIENEFADLFDYNVFPLYPRIAELFDENKTFTVLLRPDNYIATIFSGTENSRIKAYFNSLSRAKIFV